MPDHGPGGPERPEERDGHERGERAVEAGLDQLQRAALGLIGSARSMLDVVERLVADRSTLSAAGQQLTSLLGGLARAAGDVLGGDGAPARPASSDIRSEVIVVRRDEPVADAEPAPGSGDNAERSEGW